MIMLISITIARAAARIITAAEPFLAFLDLKKAFTLPCFRKLRPRLSGSRFYESFNLSLFFLFVTHYSPSLAPAFSVQYADCKEDKERRNTQKEYNTRKVKHTVCKCCVIIQR